VASQRLFIVVHFIIESVPETRTGTRVTRITTIPRRTGTDRTYQCPCQNPSLTYEI